MELEFQPLILVVRFARNDLVVFARWGQKHICYIQTNEQTKSIASFTIGLYSCMHCIQ